MAGAGDPRIPPCSLVSGGARPCSLLSLLSSPLKGEESQESKRVEGHPSPKRVKESCKRIREKRASRIETAARAWSGVPREHQRDASGGRPRAPRARWGRGGERGGRRRSSGRRTCTRPDPGCAGRPGEHHRREVRRGVRMSCRRPHLPTEARIEGTTIERPQLGRIERARRQGPRPSPLGPDRPLLSAPWPTWRSCGARCRRGGRRVRPARGR